MSNEEEKDLKENYPNYFKTPDFTVNNLRYLAPYILKKGEMYKRSEATKILVDVHEKISDLKVNQSIEEIARKCRKVFEQEAKFFEPIPAVKGHYIYIGETISGNLDVIDKQTVNEELSPIKKINRFKILKKIDALSVGDQTLYVWWHPDSERLAILEGRNEWAMKVGKHNTRYVENRIDDYKTPIPFKPIFGLVVFCKEPYTLEKCIHMTLENRNKKINEVGNEWFVTSISEIEKILEFNELIPNQER